MTLMLSARISVLPVSVASIFDGYDAYITVAVYGSLLMNCWAPSAENGTAFTCSHAEDLTVNFKPQNLAAQAAMRAVTSARTPCFQQLPML
jgi:hypothetical protein